MSSRPRLDEKLSTQQCNAYEQIAQVIVRRATDDYSALLRAGSITKSVDSKQWKLIKKRENVRIFKAHGRNAPSARVTEMEADATIGLHKWEPQAALLCVGTLTGSVEDAMYGTITPTQIAMATRSAILQDEFVQHGVLQDIKLPTIDEPFRYIGLKWAKRASKVATIVRARELIYLEASGFCSMEVDGRVQRVGYAVYHSVEPVGMSFAKTKGLVRANYSMCSLFRECSPGVTEIYASLASNPGGNIPPKLAAIAAACALIACAGVMECALIKKLSRRFAAANEEADRSTRVAVVKMKGSNWYCLQCARSLSSFHSLHACQICRQTVCSRCITTNKLAVTTTSDRISLTTVHVCKSCVAGARSTDAAHVAQNEFVKGRAERDATEANLKDPLERLSEMPRRSDCSKTVLLGNSASTDLSFQYESPRESDLLARTYFRPVERPSISLSEPDLLSGRTTLPEWDVDAPDYSSGRFRELDDGIELIEPIPVRENAQEKLLRKMTDLSIQAEQTYFYTKQQALSFQLSPVEADIQARQAKRALSRSAPLPTYFVDRDSW